MTIDPVKVWYSEMFHGPRSLGHKNRGFEYTYRLPDGKVHRGYIWCYGQLAGIVSTLLSIESRGGEMLTFKEGCPSG